MLQFVCDFCGNVKESGETWVNGVAAENMGTQAARREVIIDPTWRRERAILPLAVHFCSLECKDNYLEQLFNKPVPVLEVVKTTVDNRGVRKVTAKKKLPSSAARLRRKTSRKARAH
jgi:hypothetical protein